jgi:predicted GNAT superfamily acetyltransferase
MIVGSSASSCRMTAIAIRDAIETDFASILELNEREVRQTSPMDDESLRRLDSLSSYHKVAVVGDRVEAFVLAISHGAPYANDNYRWFAARFARFLYVDRIVVGKDFPRLGIGSRLYEDMFGYAHAQRVECVTCEYNIDPPNPASRAFHDKFGFTERGTQRVADGIKRVSLQAVAI